MLIGVLSDTHGRLDTTRSAMELLRKRRVEQLIHCGDVGSLPVLDLMVGIPAAFVWGNCDHDHHTLQHHAQVSGIHCCGALGRLTLDSAIVSFLHGDDHRQLRTIIAAQDCDFLFHGHTHVRTVDDAGKVRIVNPGALHRAMVKTVAIVDTRSRDVEFLEVE